MKSARFDPSEKPHTLIAAHYCVQFSVRLYQRYQTSYTAPCNGVVRHGAQSGGLRVFTDHTRKNICQQFEFLLSIPLFFVLFCFLFVCLLFFCTFQKTFIILLLLISIICINSKSYRNESINKINVPAVSKISNFTFHKYVFPLFPQ